MRHLRFFPRYYMTHADMMRLLPSRNYGVAGQAVWPTGNVASTHACIPRAKDRPILDRMMTHGTCPISVCISFNRRFHAGPACHTSLRLPLPPWIIIQPPTHRSHCRPSARWTDSSLVPSFALCASYGARLHAYHAHVFAGLFAVEL